MSHKGNDYLVDNLLDREVKKPKRKKLKTKMKCSMCSVDIISDFPWFS